MKTKTVYPGCLKGTRFCVGLLLLSLLSLQLHASGGGSERSTLDEARAFLGTQPIPDSSAFWPNVRPNYFMENLHQCLDNPLYAFDNHNTNFCGYTAISYITMEQDPAGFIRFMLELYKNGEAQFGEVKFTPSAPVRRECGLLKYKGQLDINPATQMWMMCLADHFKGYLNFFNKRYDVGDENRMWASTNYGKFNRMLGSLFNWRVKARGSDLIRPGLPEIYQFIREKKDKSNTVVLYLNNRLLYKKKHVATRLGVPTHYVILLDIEKVNDELINITYMDGGRKTLQQINPELLKKIVYGVTWCRNRSPKKKQRLADGGQQNPEIQNSLKNQPAQ